SIIVTYSITIVPGPAFTVRHYQRKGSNGGPPPVIDPKSTPNINDYILVDTHVLQSVTGMTVTVEPMNYEGFAPWAGQQLTHEINADGSSIIDIFYLRNLYTMHFRTSGGTYVSPITREHGETVYVSEVAFPTRQGYTFAGWTPPLPAVMPIGGKEVIANWIGQSVLISVYYMVRDADGQGYDLHHIESKSAIAGTVYNPAIPSIPSYSYEKHDEGVVVDGVFPTVVHIYYTRNIYNYRFYDADSGNLLHTISAPWGANIRDEWEALLTQYPNRRWTQNANGSSGPFVSYIDRMTDAFDRNYYSKASSGDVYTVNYYTEQLDANGQATNTFDLYLTVTMQSDTPLVATYTKDYVSITGFHQTNNLAAEGWVSIGGGDYEKNFPADRVLDLYYYRNQYSITFKNEHFPNTQKTFYYGADISSCNAPPDMRPFTIPQEWVFLYWTYDETHRYDNQPIDFTGMTMPAHNNLFFTAFWEKPIYFVRYFSHDVYGEEYLYRTEIVQKGKNATEGILPTRPGYIFLHWNLRGQSTPFSFGQPINDDMELVAQWLPDYVNYWVSYWEVSPSWQPGNLPQGSMKQISPNPKGVKNQLAGSTITEYAPAVAGFVPVLASQTKVLTGVEELDAIDFYYKPVDSVSYVVNYFDYQGNVLLPQKTVNNVGTPTVTEYAPAISGYTPNLLFQTLTLTAENALNVITFVYTPNASESYTVEHYYANLTTGQYNGTPDEVENLSGPIDALVTATQKPRDGYALDAANSTTWGHVNAAGTLVLRLYYSRVAVAWTMRHIDIDTGAALVPDDTGFMLYGETLTAAAKTIADYAFAMSDPPSGQITMDSDPGMNVITMYYIFTDSLVILADSDAVVYDGQPHTLPGGYTFHVGAGSASDLTLSGFSVTGATGTNAGSYASTFNNQGGLVVTSATLGDVTNRYQVSFVDGSLEIAKRDVTVAPVSTSTPYTGVYQTSPLQNQVTAQGLVAGHTAQAVVSGGGKLVGEYPLTIANGTVLILDGNSVDVTMNYAVTEADGELTIAGLTGDARIPVSIQPDDMIATYTGGLIQRWTTSGQVLINGAAVAPDTTVIFMAEGSATAVGTFNLLKVIVTGPDQWKVSVDGVDMSVNYRLDPVLNGNLIIQQADGTIPLEIIPKTVTRVYTGISQLATVGDGVLRVDGQTYANRAELLAATGLNVSFLASAIGTLPGMYSTIVDLSGVMVKYGNVNVTDSYLKTAEPGQFIITNVDENDRIPVHIMVGDINSPFNGYKQTVTTDAAKKIQIKNVDLENVNLVSNDKLSVEFTAVGEGFTPGKYPMTIENLGNVIVKLNGVDVTQNYTITQTSGTLTIYELKDNERIALTISPDSEWAYYSGQVIGKTVTSGGILHGGVDIATMPGDVSVTFNAYGQGLATGYYPIAVQSALVMANGTDVTSNYQIVSDDGTLEIRHVPAGNEISLYITPDDAIRKYNSTEQTVAVTQGTVWHDVIGTAPIANIAVSFQATGVGTYPGSYGISIEPQNAMHPGDFWKVL
ncbi:MAG: InlB B-repeat-containing protein, partial [Clostridia bacterium]|nr:InlB B-repeat-containing protein [Clostridia bacterium]